MVEDIKPSGENSDMSRGGDRRLIEDYLPLAQIGEESRRQKRPSGGHISTLHLWWGRRPLAACRAAVYATFVPAPSNGQERGGYGKVIAELVRWKVSESTVLAARKRVLEANDGQPPKVLDMFAGGGAIPLEALRLGCEAHAVELNPVAHLIELCTLVYPQKYGNRLGAAVNYWGNWVLGRVKTEVGDLYPEVVITRGEDHLEIEGGGSIEKETMTPVAFLWTRTVACPNPECRATVPLVRQTWLNRKAGRFAALKMQPEVESRRVRFTLVEAQSEDALGLDPSNKSTRGETTCLLCGASVKGDYIKGAGQAGKIGQQLMAVVCTRPEVTGKSYIEAEGVTSPISEEEIESRIVKLCEETGLTRPTEPIIDVGKQALFVVLYGLARWSDLFTPRQLLVLLTFVKWVRAARTRMLTEGLDSDFVKAIASYLAFGVDKVASKGNNMCTWQASGEKVGNSMDRGALPMVWDFPETNPLAGGSGSWQSGMRYILESIEENVRWDSTPAMVVRCDAGDLPYPEAMFDAVLTDPPYYDNIPYSNLSDFFYVWLKRTVGDLYPEHFRTDLTPKKAEAVMEPSLHGGDHDVAEQDYEGKMLRAFQEANRVLKPGALMVVVYAHKTTHGWTTLVDALRNARFVVTEAWPVSTEDRSRQRAQESAALGSSIFIVARKREADTVGDYLNEVRPALSRIVHERVNTLLDEVSGADLFIAAVGAGLRAYTQHARVELPSGEEVASETYLDEVQREVLETVLEAVTRESRTGLGRVDKASQFYIHYRLQHGVENADFNEANILAHGVGVELDGPGSLATGSLPLAEKVKVKGGGNLIGLLDFQERGSHENLGLPLEGRAAYLIDILHRLLWLLENRPREVVDFMRKAGPDLTALRIVAQALAGKALAGEGGAEASRTKEQQAIGNLLASWKRVVEEGLVFEARKEEGERVKVRQKRLDEGE